MRALAVASLKPGTTIREPCLHQSGLVLFDHGQVLTEGAISRLAEAGIEELYLLEAGERMQDVRQALILAPRPVKEFPAGQVLNRSVYDQAGRLLLEAGTTIPASFADSLARRGIDSLYVRKPEDVLQTQQGRQLQEALAQEFNTAKSITGEMEALNEIELKVVRQEDLNEARLNQLVDSTTSLEVVPDGASLERELRIRERLVGHSDEEKKTFIDLYRESLENVRDLFMRIGTGSSIDGQVVRRVAQRALACLIRNRELLMAAGMMTLPGNYLISHSVAVAIVSINIGAAMGFSKHQVLALGHGALLHDVGMLRISPSIYNKDGQLSDREWKEVQRHPSYGLDMLQKIIGIPVEVPYIVYQSHERVNGSGYPRGKRDAVIHTFAKIVGVADVYNSICSLRPHRPAKTPYEAMEQLVLMCGQRQLDPGVVRAFLRCNSMFPIGSWVQLSDGCRARVVGANKEDYMRPIVSVLINGGGEQLNRPLQINLLEQKALRVVQALGERDMGAITELAGF